ncbi:hypothetical protein [Corallococcus exiguus]|uniref:hypothetical protein n=1 Tax=Corallococcus exiguus TaxID=83462 RepID=UPI001120D36B|nr:hypothetical protein [Corallococcus exiguus]TNV65327.1 hypothetical protein FH620_10040 [Corallococcus exiguus]
MRTVEAACGQNEESARAKAWWQEQPSSFRFETEPAPVKIHLRQTAPPYLVVDFGCGQNAAFDPVTMYCSYSD